jgi:hypothetical protein
MNKSLKLARGGIYTAIGFLCIYLSSVIPVNKFYLMGIAACIIPISVITTGLKNSYIVYISTSLLSLIVLGLRGSVFSYIAFFGIYGFIKYYIEKLKNFYLEIALKLVFFNISLYLIFLLFKSFIAMPTTKFPMPVIIIICEFVFLIFDYALSVFITYFSTRYLKK